ncbi:MULTISPECIES: TfpX/TfpZ family type IV pilin accessory protein [unclassified Acinetobacter]|uniref:TfpX/TfpZ family type IV pilin accessory protein n=1 Tax=unclassified Acinetobacter TaxID=196816 RepID=UPI0015D3FED7|nr:MULTISPECIES: TfpX/TfpZ family type IV pilin accessory protein [unclassified Acinetobacter]
MSKRVKFFISHLTISALIACCIISVIFLLWYPGALASAEGVTYIILMLIIIDVIIGPALGFLVYKENKKTLKIDLGVIIILQITALSYGVYNIAQSRPIWIVQAGSIFQVVRLNMIDVDSQERAEAVYQEHSLLKPQWVAVNEKIANARLFAEPTIMPETYTNMKAAIVRISTRAKSIDQLQNFNQLNDVIQIIDKYPSASGWLPLRAADQDKVVLIDTNKGEVIKIVDLRPWN